MNKGSLLAVIASRFPGVNEDSEFPLGDSWALIDEEIHECPRCGGRSTIVVRLKQFNPLTGVVIYCAKEGKIYKAIDLDHGQLSSIESIATGFYETYKDAEFTTISFVEAKKSKSKGQPKVDSVTTAPIVVDSPLKVTVEVPQGFRNVAWLKSHEAQAIANAYAKEKTVPVLTTAGVKVFEAVYNKDSKETQKFHANVKASRIRKDGRERVVGWIRNEEALAVLQAQAEKQSIEFDHEAYGKGGLVEYFDPESSAAKTFLSTTRLLRRL